MLKKKSEFLKKKIPISQKKTEKTDYLFNEVETRRAIQFRNKSNSKKDPHKIRTNRKSDRHKKVKSFGNSTSSLFDYNPTSGSDIFQRFGNSGEYLTKEGKHNFVKKGAEYKIEVGQVRMRDQDTEDDNINRAHTQNSEKSRSIKRKNAQSQYYQKSKRSQQQQQQQKVKSTQENSQKFKIQGKVGNSNDRDISPSSMLLVTRINKKVYNLHTRFTSLSKSFIFTSPTSPKTNDQFFLLLFFESYFQ